jgi:hypothetical protein
MADLDALENLYLIHFFQSLHNNTLPNYLAILGVINSLAPFPKVFLIGGMSPICKPFVFSAQCRAPSRSFIFLEQVFRV